MSAGVIIPGISKTVILMLLGVYEIYLFSLATLNLQILIPMIAGLIFGGLIFLILLQFLFKHLKSYTYYAISGFVIGSFFVIYPGFSFNISGLISIFVFIIFFFLGLKLS